MTLDEAKLLTAQIDRIPTLHAIVVGDRISFEGGRHGPHSLDISTSTPERVKAHWAGYVSGSAAALKVGSKVTFSRGMFGRWPGTVRRLFRSRAPWAGGPTEALAEVGYTRKNGTFGRKSVAVADLTLRVEA
jgi:hypothetical protein